MLNRFAVLDATFVFASLNHGGQGCPIYRYFGRLARLGYKPSITVQTMGLVDQEARAAYRSLCLRHGV